MEKSFREIALKMAQKEDSIVVSKLLAFCDRCRELKKFAELDLITDPITTEPCPRGLRTGAYTVLFKQNAPRLICHGNCKSDLMDSLILTVEHMNKEPCPEPTKTNKPGPGPSTSEQLYMDIKNFLGKSGHNEFALAYSVPMREFTQLAQFLESQGWRRGG